MNIHISKNTGFQTWEQRTIFGEYPLHIRPGNFTVTILFHDLEAIRLMYEMLAQMMLEIEGEFWLPDAGRFSKSATQGKD